MRNIEVTGRVSFTFDLNVGTEATFAEIEGEAEYACEIGRAPSGCTPDTFDPGEGDDCGITAFYVDCTRRNPEWISGEENTGLAFHIHEKLPAPEWLVAMMKADKKFMADLEERAAEAAHLKA